MSTVRRRRRQRLFTKDIELLLYALGDGPVHVEATVNALDDCLTEYLSDLSHKTLTLARAQGRSRIKMDDLPVVLRNDPLKLARINYIKEQTLKIEKAKKMIDYDNANVDMDDDESGNETTVKKVGRPRKEYKKKKRKITGNVTVKEPENSDDE